MSTVHSSRGILAEDAREERERIVEMLKRAYWMEIETVMSYLANSINPDGVRAQEIVASLREDIQEELGHATQFANRIKELYGIVPGSMDFRCRTVLPAAARAPDRHRARDRRRDRGGDRSDRLLQRDHRGDRGVRPGHERHGHRDPPRRGRPPTPVRGLPARVPARVEPGVSAVDRGCSAARCRRSDPARPSGRAAPHLRRRSRRDVDPAGAGGARALPGTGDLLHGRRAGARAAGPRPGGARRRATRWSFTATATSATPNSASESSSATPNWRSPRWRARAPARACGGRRGGSARRGQPRGWRSASALRLVGWSIDTHDWRGDDARAMLARARHRSHDGSQRVDARRTRSGRAARRLREHARAAPRVDGAGARASTCAPVPMANASREVCS